MVEPSDKAGSRRCAFCGNSGLTKEHVWPNWILNLLKDRLDYTHIRVTRDGKAYEGPKPEAVVKHFCKSCNNGWMADLENEVRPVLTRMIMGEAPVSLSPQAQDALARWVTKTFLVMDLFYPGHQRMLPPNFFHSFFNNRRPPKQCVVWAMAYRGGDIRLGAYASKMTVTRPASYTKDGVLDALAASLNGALLTMVMFRAIFQVLFFDEANSVPVLTVTEPPGSIALWPSRRGELNWPARNEGFDEAEFAGLLSRTIDTETLVPSERPPKPRPSTT